VEVNVTMQTTGKKINKQDIINFELYALIKYITLHTITFILNYVIHLMIFTINQKLY